MGFLGTAKGLVEKRAEGMNSRLRGSLTIFSTGMNRVASRQVAANQTRGINPVDAWYTHQAIEKPRIYT